MKTPACACLISLILLSSSCITYKSGQGQGSFYRINHQALVPWWERFGKEHVLVLQYEQCVADPEGNLAATYRFLGLDPGHRPAALHRPVSVTGEAKIGIDPEVRRRLADLYADDVSALAAAVEGLDLRLWADFAGVVR